MYWKATNALIEGHESMNTGYNSNMRLKNNESKLFNVSPHFIYLFFNIQQFLTNSDQVLDIVFDTGKPLWLRHSPWLSRFIFWQK